MTSLSPSFPTSVIEETRVSDAEIDAYATQLLNTKSPPEALFVDDSLGPYITSLLRCADVQDQCQVPQLAEFDSILELLEDQCSMNKQQASDCVMLIADAVIKNVIPFMERTVGTFSAGESNDFGLYSQQGGSFQNIIDELPESKSEIKTTANSSLLSKIINGMENLDPIAAEVSSPLKPDNLIPLDLMGELDDPSPDYSSSPSKSALHAPNQQYSQFKDGYSCDTIQLPQGNSVPSTHDDFPPLGTSPEAFPPLGASIEKPKKVRKGTSKKHGKSQQHSDKDLASTLFRPARPRQNSIENEESKTRSRGSSNASASMITTANMMDESNGDCNNAANIHFQQRLSSCVEILLSMNHDISEEAASAAGLLAQTDFNLAQHIIDSAISAPPICRHMLQDGCYRSDCTFSHDIERHTCLFWLRGRCGKGSACKFFHGFHEKLLNGIDTSTYHKEQQIDKRESSSGYYQPYSTQYGSPRTSVSSLTGYPASAKDSFSGTMSPLLTSSWQITPSMPSSSLGSAPVSFANIASKGYQKNQFSAQESSPLSNGQNGMKKMQIPTVPIPQDLWMAHENRDSSAFYISDPLTRYQAVATSNQRSDVIDLHFQSINTFPVVLDTILPLKLNKSEANLRPVWIITGTGHHVGSRTHQKGGGALETAVIEWLLNHNYKFSRGKDRNGRGGALLVDQQQ